MKYPRYFNTLKNINPEASSVKEHLVPMRCRTPGMGQKPEAREGTEFKLKCSSDEKLSRGGSATKKGQLLTDFRGNTGEYGTRSASAIV